MPPEPPSKDNRWYITVTETFPEHPKIVGLSDKAFRALIELWCYCSRTKTDGAVPAVVLNRMTTPRARTELTAAGLIEQLSATEWAMHDYLKHQWSRDEIADRQQSKSDAGAFGAHTRFHANRGITKDDCRYCRAGLTAIPNG